MNRLTRFLAIYGCGTLAAYSLVPYKTPWCIISLLWPFFFLLGDAVDFSIRFLQKEGFSALVAWLSGLMGACTILGVSLAASVQLNYLHPTEPGEYTVKIPVLTASWQALWTLPTYVYVQTTTDLFKLTEPLEKLTAQDPASLHMPANILLSSYHPLPWVLGRFTHVGYYDKESPPVMDAGFILAENDRTAQVEAQLKDDYFVCPFQLRDGMNGGKLYFNASRFASVFPGREPEFQPEDNKATEGDLPVMPAVPVGKAVSPTP